MPQSPRAPVSLRLHSWLLAVAGTRPRRALAPARPAVRPEENALARAASAAAVALLALHALLAWWVRAPGVATGHDDAVYILLAHAIRGFGYQELFHTGEPWHTQYPPGYPALLAIWGPLFGDRIDGFLLLGIAIATAALGLVFLTLRRLWSPTLALLCLLPLAVNPYLVFYAGQLASEGPYLFFSMLAICLLAAARPSAPWFVAGAAAAIMAGLTRGIGVTLLLAVGALWVLSGRWRVALPFAAACALTAGAWLLWMWRAPEHYVGVSYLADALFAGDAQNPNLATVLLGRLTGSIPLYFGMIIPQALPLPGVPGTLIDNVLGALVVAIGFTIGLLALWRRWRAAALYLVAYMALLLLWPWWLDRFVVPILPLLIAAVLLGVDRLAERLRPRLRTPAVLALALLMTGLGAYYTAGLVREQAGCEQGRPVPPAACLAPDQQSFFAAAGYINEYTPRHAVFLTAKPATLYYYTDRQSASFSRMTHGPASDFLPTLRVEGVEYILAGSVHSGELTALADRLEANCEGLELVAHFPVRTYLFRVAPGELSAAHGARACAAVAEYRRRNADRVFGG